jgi:hypothetical protein
MSDKLADYIRANAELAGINLDLNAKLVDAERRLEKALSIMTPAQVFHYDKPHKWACPDYSGHPQYEAEPFRTTDSASPSHAPLIGHCARCGVGLYGGSEGECFTVCTPCYEAERATQTVSEEQR